MYIRVDLITYPKSQVKNELNLAIIKNKEKKQIGSNITEGGRSLPDVNCYAEELNLSA